MRSITKAMEKRTVKVSPAQKRKVNRMKMQRAKTPQIMGSHNPTWNPVKH